ncbi:DIP1984 family protein [Antrihabitans sp. YC3-6]|uniref:DIP1984 family protein n=1 Tax=Antrihabitans stalagmiti TaxID=2799499 RepID=A0A934NQF2_9NOCA|nr:DIP1984 family protein [Antrihabitans stalagmiti]MBJ8339432.1 DIP1984 family protein [Antrihabitans stalagmiti]
MKLAEALALRADNARKAEQLRTRIVDNARYQEGETPAENAAALLADSQAVFDELESLIRRINKTNAAATVNDGTMTDALARRDVLRLRHRTVTAAADAASGTGGQGGYARQLRSELTYVSALPVAEMRSTADDLARQLRELDVEIQRRNWEVDLVD